METLTFLMTSSFYPPFHIGGDAVHVQYLADELVNRGHEVHILHSLDAYYVKRKNPPKNQEEHEGVYTYPVKTRLNSSSYLAYAFGSSSVVNNEFEKLVKELKPDIVHHHNVSLLGYNVLGKRSDYCNLYTAHDYWLICQQNGLMKSKSEICTGKGVSCLSCTLKYKRTPHLWRHSKNFKKALSDVDIFIAPSDFATKKISQALGIEVATLLNFVPRPKSDSEPTGFSRFFLYAGVLENQKGLMNLIGVYETICRQLDAKLLIVGQGSLKGKIEEFVKHNQLENKIVVLGRVDQIVLYRLLSDAEALVVPSIWHENCPLIALEAISLGTPVISSDKGGLPEIVEKIDPNLIYHSTDEFKQILLNFSKSKYSKNNIKLTFEQHFSPEVYLKRYFELLNAGKHI
jgi:glycosyltransferase involved in cell wall biosynthesis